MADLTSVSTMASYSVQGNRRVVTVHVSSAGGSTSDTVSVPHLSAITALVGASYRTTVFGSSFGVPYLTVGSSANAVQIVRSSDGIALPITFTVEGR